MNKEENSAIQHHRNGRAWATGIGAAAVLTLGSWAWHSVTGRVDAVQVTQSQRGERIAKLETEMIGIKETMARIEKKLDQALERK